MSLHQQYHLRYSPEARIFRFQPINRLKNRKDPGSIPGTGKAFFLLLQSLLWMQLWVGGLRIQGRNVVPHVGQHVIRLHEMDTTLASLGIIAHLY
jgi:hypothetical protein